MISGGYWQNGIETAPRDGQRIILLLKNGGTTKRSTVPYKIKPVCAYYADGPNPEWREVFTGQSLSQWGIVGWAQLMLPPVSSSGKMVL
jgi:hypothetical protein